MNDLISKLSEIRSQYNCFDESEEPYYRALSEAIKALSKRADEDTIFRQAAIDAVCAVCGNDCDKSEFVYNAPQDEQVIICPEHYVLCKLPSAQPGIKEMAVDIGYLRDWYQSSVLGDEWPDRYVEEVYHDFYLIPKQGDERDE